MCNVWKIGSRWGDYGTSLLDLFIGYGCVFFNTEGNPQYDKCKDVKAGDILIIADGIKVVGIGKALSPFVNHTESDIVFTHDDWENYIDDINTRICKASIILLPQKERMRWGEMKRGRFFAFRPGDPAQRTNAIEYWDSLQEEKSQGVFNIESGTYSLLPSESRQPILSIKRLYQIPIYQRPYSWNENNLRRLMEDLRDAVKNQEPVFMGTMQLSEPIPLDPEGYKNTYDIIDGQQRIISFIIMLGLLGILPDYAKKIRTLVNRGKSQEDLDDFWKALDNWAEFKRQQQDYIHNPYLRNALTIDALLDELFDGSDEAPNREDLKSFIKSNVLFVVIETHASLSKTLKIFNTINTAGLDLGADDLFKIRFYEYLKQCGKQDDVFDQISNIYARIAQGKKEERLGYPTMGDLLSTYQRILIAKYDLSNNAFNMGYERFYDQLFDTVLNVREWPDFKKLKKVDSCFMPIEELSKLLDCFEIRGKMLSNNWDYRILECFIWETRYGEQIWNMEIIALFFNAINKEQLYLFALNIFKLVCPPSLYFAKRVYGVISSLIQLLKQMPNCNSVFEQIEECFSNWRIENKDLKTALSESFDHEISSYPKWKLLICRLVEYLKVDTKDELLFKKLFETSIDIEHIQCYTDRTDRDKVWSEWGAELNKLGNLVLLESSINKSINNRTEAKPEGYHNSHFESVKELEKQVGLDENDQSKWKKDDAVSRRKNNASLLTDFILGGKI